MNPQVEENLQQYLMPTSLSLSCEIRSVPHFYTLADGQLQLQHLPNLTHTMGHERILRKLGGVSAHLRMHQTMAHLPYVLVHRDDNQEITSYDPCRINPDVERKKEGLAEVLYDLQHGATTTDALVNKGIVPLEASFNIKHFWIDLNEKGLIYKQNNPVACITTMYTTLPRERSSWHVTFVVSHQWVKNLPYLMRMEVAYKIHQKERIKDMAQIRVTGQGYFKIEGASLSSLKLVGGAYYFDLAEQKTAEGFKVGSQGMVRRNAWQHQPRAFSTLDVVLERLFAMVESPSEKVVHEIAHLEYMG